MGLVEIAYAYRIPLGNGFLVQAININQEHLFPITAPIVPITEAKDYLDRYKGEEVAIERVITHYFDWVKSQIGRASSAFAALRDAFGAYGIDVSTSLFYSERRSEGTIRGFSNERKNSVYEIIHIIPNGELEESLLQLLENQKSDLAIYKTVPFAEPSLEDFIYLLQSS